MPDWTKKYQVIAYARSLGTGLSVVWNGLNYQIIHTANEKRLLNGRVVVCRT